MRVGVEPSQANDFSVTLTRGKFTQVLGPIPITKDLWESRRRPPSSEEIQVCRCKWGELRSLSTETRPDICARLAHKAARVNSLLGGNIYRINDMAKTVKESQQATVLKYASKSHSVSPVRGNIDARIRAKGEKVHCGMMTLAGCSDAPYEDQTSRGRSPPGNVIGLAPPTLRGP